MKPPIYSALDFVTMRKGESHGQAIAHSVELAKHVEELGYHRYWIPEHHGSATVASASPAILIGHFAAATQTIRVGAGGVMLLNHPPLVIAEQYGTLESIYPGRIDLGLGRAAGSSGAKETITKAALRRDPRVTGDSFPEFLAELQQYLGPAQKDQEVEASPGQDTNVPIFLLSSSGYSAQLAGELGLPFAFAAHISPQNLEAAVNIYRQHFRSSKMLNEPYVIIATFALAAETDEEAQKSFTSVQQLFLSAARNNLTKLAPPVESMDRLWSTEEKEGVMKRLTHAIVGGRETVDCGIRSLIQKTEADELMFWCETYSYVDRLRSYTLLAETVAILGDQCQTQVSVR
jgi:luciferase family oxidoreductase group 1